MLFKYKDYIPVIKNNVFIAPSAVVIGRITIDDDVSIWFNVTARADVHTITIGKRSNVQDNSVLHVTNNKFPLIIGEYVTIGHGVVVHGCTIHDNCLIGMNATILDNAEICGNSIVAAGSIIRENKKFPPGVLIAGSPAEIKRDLNHAEIEKNRQYADNYVNYKNIYLQNKNFERIQ